MNFLGISILMSRLCKECCRFSYLQCFHVDLDQLLENKWTILTFASIGVLVSSFVIGGGF